MSAYAASGVPAAAVQAKALSMLGAGAIFVGVLLSGFVLREPAPYELYMAGLIAVWALFGLRISGASAILLTLFVLFNLGGMIAITQMTDSTGAAMYFAVSMFLALTSVFFTAVLEARPQLYQTIFTAWICAAVPAAAIGVAGYFGVGGEMFVKYGRAAGTFQDPNVFGPFLATPAVYLLYRIFTGRLSLMLVYGPMLLVLASGVFFSFSRGAWAVLLLSSILMIGFLLMQNLRATTKIRILVLSVLAVAGLAIAVMIALQIPGVADVFSSRAQLEQSYDGGRFGRFGRHWVGLQWAMEKPLGIGPLVFGKLLGEDTHNVWLKALMDYGWLGFVSYLLIIVITIAGGFKLMFKDRPWRPFLVCAYSVFLAHVGLGFIIDTDHWRHFYLLIGLIWGGMALEFRHAHQRRANQVSARALPV